MSIINTIFDTMDRIKYAVENTSFFKVKSNFGTSRDLELLYELQPVSNLKEHDNYITLGDGYMTCLHVYSTPESLIQNWLFRLCNHDNVITIIDVDTLDKKEVIDNINRAINEHESRYEEAHSRGAHGAEKEAVRSYTRLDELLEEVEELGNSIKALHIKLYIYAKTFNELEERILSIEKKIEEDGFAKYGININEQIVDVHAMYNPISLQNKSFSYRKGLPCDAHAMAFGLPFHYIGWTDKWGYYIGDTSESAGYGPVLFYPFTRDHYRRTYDGVVIGDKRSGKSTTLKMLIEQNLATGNKVRIIDITSEYNDITRKYGGIVIKMDGTGGHLNPLEILKMEDDDNLNWHKHIAKLSLMYQLKRPTAEDTEISLYKNLLNDLYLKKGIITTNELGEKIYKNITGLAPTEYPLLEDFLSLVDNQLKIQEEIAETSELAKVKINHLFNIHTTIQDLINNYGKMFNEYTDIGNLLDADIIDFDIRSISDGEPTIFDMQLFNILSIAYDSCMNTGIDMKYKKDNNLINEEDIIHHVIYIDESHKSLNSRKPFAIHRMLDILRQDTKYFIGVWFATQNIRDAFPETESETAEELKVMFSQCQYKFIFHQDSESAKIIQKIFGDIVTDNQCAMIPHFKQRQCLVNFGVHTIQMTCKELSPDILAYYGGGM